MLMDQLQVLFELIIARVSVVIVIYVFPIEWKKDMAYQKSIDRLYRNGVPILITLDCVASS